MFAHFWRSIVLHQYTSFKYQYVYLCELPLYINITKKVNDGEGDTDKLDSIF